MLVSESNLRSNNDVGLAFSRRRRSLGCRPLAMPACAVSASNLRRSRAPPVSRQRVRADVCARAGDGVGCRRGAAADSTARRGL